MDIDRDMDMGVDRGYFAITVVGDTPLYDSTLVQAALAAANIRIMWVNSMEEDRGLRSLYNVVYEFQWRSKGNYIWSRTAVTRRGRLEEILLDIYEDVRSMRGRLETSDSRGVYRYLDDEAKGEE